ncbi:MAG: uridine kinase [Actinomycetota bacterium]|nr:uridine kinase [Actinomycetota bacterium]
MAVDGVDGAGKTTFADSIAKILRERHSEVIRVSVDDFHHVRAIRYRCGRDSPEGFWLDSFNYSRLHADVLDPLGPGGTRRFRRAAHDLTSDAELHPPEEQAVPGAVLVLDGLFLHRDGLAQLWDLSVWLDVPVEVSVGRRAARDGSHPDPEHPSLARYVRAQTHYLASCHPADRAHVVIDNAEADRPILITQRLPGQRRA